jgi:hypothetical protein
MEKKIRSEDGLFGRSRRTTTCGRIASVATSILLKWNKQARRNTYFSVPEVCHDKVRAQSNSRDRL